MACEHCKRLSPRFDFDQRCCRVRFLLGLRNKTARDGWIDRFSHVYGLDAAQEDSRQGRQIFRLVGEIGLAAAIMHTNEL
jgi:hypothetical protein